MKALTLHQPWATLVVRGVKRFETRDWAYSPTHFEDLGTPPVGRYVSDLPITLAIHAGRTIDVPFTRWLRDVVGVLDSEDLPLGAVVGTVRYVDWHWSYESIREQLSERFDGGVDGAAFALEQELGDWSDGRRLWEFADQVEFAAPQLARGHQRIWTWLQPDFEGLPEARSAA